MRQKRQEIGDRTKLAGGGGRRFEAMGKTGQRHADASAGTEAVGRRWTGTRSGGRTAPAVMAKIAAETRGEGPRAPNRSLRTASAEMSPIRSAISASDRDSRRIQAFSETIASGLPTSRHTKALAELPTALTLSRPPAPPLPPGRLAEVLAILAIDLVEVLAVGDRSAVLERIANRFDGHGRTTGGSEAAAMLGAVGAVLMRLER